MKARLAAAAAAVLLVAACAASTPPAAADNPKPLPDRYRSWASMDGSAHAVFWCNGTTGVYQATADSYRPVILPTDPECAPR